MKKQIIVAGLFFALSGLAAVGQTSTTPGVPPTQRQEQDQQATPPYNQSNTDQSTADQDQGRANSDQQYPDNTRRDRDANDNYNSSQTGQYNSDQNGTYRSDHDRQDQNSQDQNSNDQYSTDRNGRYSNDSDRTSQGTYSDRDRTNSDQNYQQGDRNSQYPQTGDHDRNWNRSDRMDDNGNVDHDRDRVSGNGYDNQLQSTLQQQSNLSGVTVSDSGSRIVLRGTVPTGRDRREALRLAQQYANGRTVVDRIQVSGNGSGNDRDDQR